MSKVGDPYLKISNTRNDELSNDSFEYCGLRLHDMQMLFQKLMKLIYSESLLKIRQEKYHTVEYLELERYFLLCQRVTHWARMDHLTFHEGHFTHHSVIATQKGLTIGNSQQASVRI